MFEGRSKFQQRRIRVIVFVLEFKIEFGVQEELAENPVNGR